MIAETPFFDNELCVPGEAVTGLDLDELCDEHEYISSMVRCRPSTPEAAATIRERARGVQPLFSPVSS